MCETFGSYNSVLEQLETPTCLPLVLLGENVYSTALSRFGECREKVPDSSGVSFSSSVRPAPSLAGMLK